MSLSLCLITRVNQDRSRPGFDSRLGSILFTLSHFFVVEVPEAAPTRPEALQRACDFFSPSEGAVRRTALQSPLILQTPSRVLIQCVDILLARVRALIVRLLAARTGLEGSGRETH